MVHFATNSLQMPNHIGHEFSKNNAVELTEQICNTPTGQVFFIRSNNCYSDLVLPQFK